MNMTGRTLLIALAGAAFLVFLFPYTLGPFAMNGTDTLVMVALLWVGVCTRPGANAPGSSRSNLCRFR